MPHRPPVKFLLVDDLEANLIALEGLLARDGLELLKARSGPEALELLLIHEVALAFIDVQMPEMSGFELAELMRGTDRTRAVPIVFLTAGSVDPQRRIRGYETGAVDFLPKPIDPANLLNKAAVFIELAHQRQELRAANEKLAESNAALARADRRKDEFLAMLAHELRNPLAPILTGLEVMVSSPGNAEIVGNLAAMMRRQMAQMVHLIDDLLDISRINTGKISLKSEDVLLLPVIQDAIESSRPLIDKAGHQLGFTIDDEQISLTGDPHRLSQVISNLLSNAAKYTPNGGRIAMDVSRHGSHQVKIRVSDNGEGIAPDQIDRIFGLFEQVDPKRQNGLGLGLTLVKNLVTMHGGSIVATSAGLGKGSEFTLILPVHARGTSPLPATPEQETPITLPSVPRRVMVVDDSQSIVRILAMFIEQEGMEISVAYDGEEAVNVAAVFQPDMIFMDLGMPKMDGFAAARQLRAAHPDTLLIALSGWGRDEDRAKSRDAGFDGHMVKPVAPDDIRRFLAMLA
ncbi:MAG: response regulator [Verrucomicrobiota bacterium]